MSSMRHSARITGRCSDAIQRTLGTRRPAERRKTHRSGEKGLLRVKRLK